MDDELMKCRVCGTPRVSRYAAYCHVCGSPLPELPPEPDDAADSPPQPQGWEDPAAAAGAVFGATGNAAANPVESYPTGSNAPGSYPASSPAGTNPPAPGPVRQDDSAYRAQAGGQALPPASEPPQGGGARVYDRPETPPSVVRRRRMTLILAGVGVLISLLLVAFGPLRSVFSARSGPDWTPGGTGTPAAVIIPTLPPGVSAAEATARARHTATIAPTWTAGVDLGTPATATTALLPTLAPATVTTAPTMTPVAPAPPTAVEPSPTPEPPTVTQSPPAEAPLPTLALTAAPTAAAPVPGATSAVSMPGANLPGVIAGGKVVAFVSDRTGSPQIWIADAAGANQIPVTRDGQNTSPAWSLDDRYLYYVGKRGDQTSVYRLDVTTGKEEQVLQDPSILSARPLPNGQLAIMRTENGRYALYIGDRRLFQLDRAFQYQFSTGGRRVVIDPTSDPRVISVVDVANTKAQDVAPARSWNAGWGQGDRLTYVSDRSGIASVYVAGPNGEEAHAISPAGKWSQAPSFSSDGSQIAFIGGDGPAWNVYVVGSNGQNAHMVGGPANPAKSPVWQPGGQLIAYETNRAGNWDLYVADPNGNEHPLTNDPGNDTDPAWTW